MNGRRGLGEKDGQLEKLAGRNMPQQAVAGPCLDEDMVHSVALALFPNSGETKKLSHSKVPSNTLCLGLLCALCALHRVPIAWTMHACSGVCHPRNAPQSLLLAPGCEDSVYLITTAGAFSFSTSHAMVCALIKDEKLRGQNDIL